MSDLKTLARLVYDLRVERGEYCYSPDWSYKNGLVQGVKNAIIAIHGKSALDSALHVMSLITREEQWHDVEEIEGYLELVTPETHPGQYEWKYRLTYTYQFDNDLQLEGGVVTNLSWEDVGKNVDGVFYALPGSGITRGMTIEAYRDEETS